MPVSHNLTIGEVEVDNAHPSGYSQVITEIHWRLVTDPGDGSELVESYGSVSLPPPNGGRTFVPYPPPDAQLKAWVRAELLTQREDGTGVPGIEARHVAQIANRGRMERRDPAADRGA